MTCHQLLNHLKFFIMKTQSIIINSILVLTICFTSCKEDFSALIQKIETTQVQLHQYDSTLISQRNELSMILFTDTTRQSQKMNPSDTTFVNLVSHQNTLITRIEIISQKNKELINQLNEHSADPEKIFKEYTTHADELELMKPEINSTKESYEKLVKKVGEAFKNPGDTTKTK